MAEKKIISVNSITAMPCSWSVGKTLDRFLDGLVEGKIRGLRCPRCKKVYVPPRRLCDHCFQAMEEWVEVGPEGTVLNYTVAHVDFRNEPLDEPKVIGLIRLDGSDSALFGEIKGGGGDLLGRRVRAVFREERKGVIRDISHYQLL